MMTEREIIMLDCHLSTKRRDDKTNGRSIIILCCTYVAYIPVASGNYCYKYLNNYARHLYIYLHN